MLNVVALVGRLVRDPELKYTPSGVAVCSMSIAVDRQFKSKDGEKETDFFDVVAWRQSAEFAAKYLEKGRLIAVNGKLQQRSWVQQDGQKRSKVEVVADSVTGLDRPKDGAKPYEGPASASENTDEPSGMDYDPFAEE